MIEISPRNVSKTTDQFILLLKILLYFFSHIKYRTILAKMRRQIYIEKE